MLERGGTQGVAAGLRRPLRWLAGRFSRLHGGARATEPHRGSDFHRRARRSGMARSTPVAPRSRWWIVIALGLLPLAEAQERGLGNAAEFLLGGAPSGCGVNMSCPPPAGGGSCTNNGAGNPCGPAGGPASQPAPGGQNVGAGNPINVLSGNKYQVEVDLPPLPGVLGLEIVRHYNSRYSLPNAAPGMLGRGWRLSYETDLHVVGNTLQIVQADGARIVFARDPRDPSLCSTADPARGKVFVQRKPGGDEYVWRWPNGRKLFFDRMGKLVQILAPTGEFVVLTRDPQGLLVKVTDPQGRSLTLSYVDRRTPGRYHGVKSIDSPVGRFTYGYGNAPTGDGNADKATLAANLVKVSLPSLYEAGQKAHPYANRGVTTSAVTREYHYEDKRFPTLLTGITVAGAGSDGQPMHRRIASWAYDAAGRAVLSVSGPLPAEGAPTEPNAVRLDFSQPGKTLLTTADGRQTVYLTGMVAGEQRLLEARGPGCASCGRTDVRYRYDGQGRLTATTLLDADGKPRATTQTDFDAASRPLKVTEWEFQNGRPVAKGWVRYEYASPPETPGATGEAALPSPLPVLVVRPSVVPGREHRTRITYNEAGQPVSIAESGFSPAPADGGAAEPRPLSRTVTYKYQTVQGRTVLVDIDGPLPNGPRADPSDSDVTRLTWDARGHRVVAMVRPGNIAYRFQYADVPGESGRLLASTMQWGEVARRQWQRYFPGGAVAERGEDVLDSRGQPLATRRVELQYDATGTPQGVLRDDGRKTTLFPNTREAATSGAAEPLPGMPPSAATGHWHPGLALQFGEPGSAAEAEVLALSANDRAAVRLIDDFGRVVAIRNPGQGWRTADYDEADRPVTITDPRGATQRLRYDATGQLVEVQRTNPRGDRVETVALRWRGPYKVEEAVMDATGQLRHRSRYERDAWGQVQGQTAEIRATPEEAPVTLSQRLHYDATGRLAARTLASGERIAYRYVAGSNPAAAGRLARIEWIRWPAWLDGLMTRLPEAWQRKTVLFQADDLGSAGKTGPQAPTTDSRGETADHGLPGAAEAAPGEAFDAAGFPSSIRTVRGAFQLSWNAAGQLERVVDAGDGKEVATYTYDAQGRRAAKLTADAAEYYLYQGTQLVSVLRRPRAATSTGGVEQAGYGHYLYAGYRPVAWIRNGDAYAVQTDARGAVTAVSPAGSGGAPVWRGDVDLWGAVAEAGARTLDPRLRLINQYADDETGLHYNVARYYDPSRGRFISPDPAGVADSVDRDTPAALLLDTTAYAAGQPDRFFDPSGAAKLTYYAITTGSDGRPLGANQGFTKARWAFVIEDLVADGTGETPAINQRMQEYAQAGVGLLYDKGGNFRPGSGVTTWNGGGSVVDAFEAHYGANLIEIAEFTVTTMSNRDAALLIARLTNNTAGLGQCPLAGALLPDIRFSATEPALNPAVADPRRLQRVVACGENADLNRQRIVKYEVAAELNETARPKRINKDCSADGCPGVFYSCNATGCRGTNAPPAGTHYVASYGRSQFIGATMVSELLAAYGTFTPAERAAMGMGPNTAADLRAARDRGAALVRWFNTLIPAAARYGDAAAAWDQLPAAQRARFTAETGLGEQAYEDIVRFKTSPPTNSRGVSLLGDARQAMVTEAIMSDPAMRTLLMGIFQDFDRFTTMAHALMRNNLERVLAAFPNAGEEEIAARVARLHNGGNWRAPLATLTGNGDSFNYVKRFLGDQRGEGEWRSLRCVADFGEHVTSLEPGTNGQGIGGIELTPLNLN